MLVDHGGGHGKAAFARAWRLDEPHGSRLWGELATMIALGCALSGEVRIIPSMGEQVSDEVDPYETLVAVRPGAVLRSAPNADSKAVATLDWDVLTLDDRPTSKDWYPVSLADGREGFVRRDDARSPLDFRMTIERVDGHWKVTTFVAGD